MNGKQTKRQLGYYYIYEKTVETNYSNVYQGIWYRKYYRRNTQTNFDLNCDSKFINPLFWKRVNDHFTTHIFFTINSKKYNIHQVMFPVNVSLIMLLIEGKKINKKLRFSYIRHVDGLTRLKVYNYLSITGLENVVHRSSQVILEIPNGCLILCMGDTFHAGVGVF